MKEKEMLFQNKKIFYRSMGEGPMVVFIHGFGEDGAIWDRQFDSFPDFHLIIPDLPGSGRSEMIDDMSMEGMAECVKEIIVKERTPLAPPTGELKGATVIGHSMGGYITLAFAEKYPELLNGFGLFHSTAYADSEEKKETRRKGIEFIKKNGAYEFLKASTPNLYSSLTKETIPELVREQLENAPNFSATSLVNYYEAMIARPDRTGVLKNNRVPVLFILGKYDNAVPLKDGLEQCSLPELAYIHVLENSGHMGMREQPKKANQILYNYLKDLHQTR